MSKKFNLQLPEIKATELSIFSVLMHTFKNVPFNN